MNDAELDQQVEEIDKEAARLEGIEEVAVEEAVGGQQAEDAEFLIDLDSLLLLVKNLLEFVGAGADLRFHLGHVTVGQGGPELEVTAPSQHQRNDQRGQPKGALNGVTASLFLGGLRFGK